MCSGPISAACAKATKVATSFGGPAWTKEAPHEDSENDWKRRAGIRSLRPADCLRGLGE